MADVVSVMLVLNNLRGFVSGLDKAERNVADIGTAAEKSGRKAKVGWKGIAKWGGAAAAVYGATRFLKSAVTSTEELGKTTLALQRTTGMDIKTSSEWGTVLKVRGIQTKTFQTGLVKLSKEIEKTRKGTKKHNSALEQLGITSENTAVQTGDTEKVLEMVSNRFSRMRNPAKRAALAQQLFSRTGIQLAPILFKGSKAIREQLALSDKYGAHLSGKNAKAIKEEIAHQREMQFAYEGAKIQLGTALIPVMLIVTRLIVRLTTALAPLMKNGKLLTAVIIALTVAFIAYKIVMLIATIATLGFDAALLIAIGWIALIVIGLIALGVGFYLAYKKVAWFRKGVQAVFGWIKAHWPLLLAILTGPIGIATLLIIKNFDKIKRAFQVVIDFMHRLINKIKGPLEKIVGAIDKAKGWAGGALGKVGLQEGGHVLRGGLSLVGERGPEVLALPGGATVAPLSAGGLSAAGLGQPLVVRTQLVVDRKVLADAVSRHVADKVARR